MPPAAVLFILLRTVKYRHLVKVPVFGLGANGTMVVLGKPNMLRVCIPVPHRLLAPINPPGHQRAQTTALEEERWGMLSPELVG